MPINKKIIGIYGGAELEVVHRAFMGVLRYAEDNGGFVVNDFRVSASKTKHETIPPWVDLVDGIVVFSGRIPGSTDRETADWVISGGVPAVSVGAEWKDPRIPSFYVKSSSLGNLAAAHLCDCSCRSFLYLGFTESVGSSHRFQAFKDALAKRGHKCEEHQTTLRLMGTYADEEQLRTDKKLLRLLQTLKKPLGIWTLNDNFASTISMFCAEIGLTIPEKVKILGVDDIALARTHRPSLSSIRTPGEQIGYLAMRTLHGMLLGQTPTRKTTEVAATELIGRTSTLGGVLASADILAAVEYIAQHACTGLTVKQLVENLDISRRSFEEKFHKFVGHSPGLEIQRIRLERSKELLTQTQLSIGRIAAMVGFEETAAFSKFFRLKTNKSPRAFRNEYSDPTIS